jgi:hypothetical protein
MQLQTCTACGHANQDYCTTGVVSKTGDASSNERLADDSPVGIMRYVSARNRSVKLSRVAVLKMILARTRYRRCKNISNRYLPPPSALTGFSSLPRTGNRVFEQTRPTAQTRAEAPTHRQESFRHLKRGSDGAQASPTRRTCTVIPVVEHGDIPVGLQPAQKLSQCSRSLGEFCAGSAANGIHPIDSPNRKILSCSTNFFPPTI